MKPLRTPRDDLKDIVAFSGWIYGVDPNEIISPSRRATVVVARQAAMRTVKGVFPKMSTSSIGKFFGRDHTTVCHSLGTLSKKRPPTIDGRTPYKCRSGLLTNSEAAAVGIILEQGPIRRHALLFELRGSEADINKMNSISSIVSKANAKLKSIGCEIKHGADGYYIPDRSRDMACGMITRTHNGSNSNP